MTTQTDPISQIKTAEESSKKKIEEAKSDFTNKLNRLENDLEKKLEEFEDNLKEQGRKKLEGVKKEAGEILKTRMATSETSRNKLIQDGKARQVEAVKEIVSIAKNHFK